MFVAEIDCPEEISETIKIGLSAKWAIKNGVSVRGADLSFADLSYEDLRGADLSGSFLCRANFGGANLIDANLNGANLTGADLHYANLSGADMGGAILNAADLNDTNLGGADIDYTELSGVHGINKYIKSIHLEYSCVTYTADIIQIAFEEYSIEEWRSFDDDKIVEIYGKEALEFWHKWKDTIFQIIEMCPAEPTNGSKEKKANAEKQRLRLENGKGTDQ